MPKNDILDLFWPVESVKWSTFGLFDSLYGYFILKFLVLEALGDFSGLICTSIGNWVLNQF